MVPELTKGFFKVVPPHAVKSYGLLAVKMGQLSVLLKPLVMFVNHRKNGGAGLKSLTALTLTSVLVYLVVHVYFYPAV